MFCTNCGKELANGSNFCPECGTAVVRDTYEHAEPSDPRLDQAPLEPVIQPEVRTHPLTIVGFVLSFFTPLVGLILCIIARNKANKDPLNAGSKELTVAGIVISIVGLVLSALIFSFYAFYALIIAAIFSA